MEKSSAEKAGRAEYRKQVLNTLSELMSHPSAEINSCVDREGIEVRVTLPKGPRGSNQEIRELSALMIDSTL